MGLLDTITITDVDVLDDVQEELIDKVVEEEISPTNISGCWLLFTQLPLAFWSWHWRGSLCVPSPLVWPVWLLQRFLYFHFLVNVLV